MLILFAVFELLLLALIVFGDVWLIKQRRLVYVPAILLLTALAAAIGYALLVTIAFQACVSADEPCIS
jgi:hypothetical protein